MIKVGIIGGGYWGKNLIRNFHELGALAAICDKDKAVLKAYSSEYPDVKTIFDAKEIFADDNIPAVVIAAPAAVHYTLAKQALIAGKHVFVEKPLALDAAEAEELVKMADEFGKVLMVGHILQYHNAVVKLKEMIDDGELGKIQYIYSNRLNIGKIRSEENILWSFAPHDISVILMLLGEFPETVSTTGGTYLQHNIADATMTTMGFRSGVRAHIFVSWLHPFKEQKLVVVGDKKMAVFDDMRKEKLLIYPHTIEWKGRVPVAAKADAEVIKIEEGEPLKAECSHFLECIENSSVPKTDGREGLEVLKILQASQGSLNNAGKVMNFSGSVPTIDKKYFAHETAHIDPGTEIGSGTKIWHFSHILKGSRVGENCKIGQNVVIGPSAVVGNNCKIQNNVSVYTGVVLEDDVFCGPSCVFTNVFNPRSAVPRMDEIRGTVVKKGASIGANATIICGNTIGESAFIGAGSVVTKDIPSHALVMGNPARIAGWMCSCGVKIVFNKDAGKCSSCGAEYVKKGDKVVVRV